MKILSRVRNCSLVNQLQALVVLIFLFFPFFIQANNPLNVVINEIAWMGTTLSYNDEWIELYNNTEQSLNLEGWVLKAGDGTPKINLTGSIPPNGFYLLERTDDNTLPNIPADQIYTGALGDKGEDLELYDNLGNLIDSADCSSGWFGGDNSTKQTMERKDPRLPGNHSDNWGTSQKPGGTPKAKNSVAREVPLEPEVELLPEESKPDFISYPSGIFINEILPSPSGPDEKEEWIEIFNQNSFKVDLSDWQISDTEGTSKTYTFPEGTKIPAEGFLVFSRSTTKISLNNSGDGLNLIQPDGKIIDSVSYEKAPRGQSYNREGSKWLWSPILTPGSENIIPIQKTEEAESLEELEKIDINTAPLESLVKIIHIDKARAQELISLRPFYSLEELVRIKGISPERLEEIKKQGLAWVDPELKPPKIEETKPSDKKLAAVAEPFQQRGLTEKTPESLSLFLIALSLAIFSAIIILILKKKLNSKKEEFEL